MATELSELVESGVTAVGLPSKAAEINVLFKSVSTPSLDTNVPKVGNITLLAAVVVIVKSPIPFVTKLLATVIVLPVLAIPVPPFEPGSILEMVPEESAYFDVSAANE